MEELLTWIWFAECFPYGSIKPVQVLSQFPDLEEFYQNRKEWSRELSFLTSADRKRILAYQREEYLPLVEECQRKKIHIVTYQEEAYPVRLKHMDDPPMVLYYCGNLDCLRKKLCISIVGTRKCSTYSQKVAMVLARDLSLHGTVVISGCAIGIDSCAHRGALEGNSPTVAVLGTPLDVDYPASNHGLKQKILSQEGLLISEYPPGMSVQKNLFPIRNRLISGLSDGTVIVEAAEKSGSLHTANSAIEQGKELFCVPPADLFDSRYYGVKKLIRDGATVVFSSWDIVEAFRFSPPVQEFTQLDFNTVSIKNFTPQQPEGLTDEELQIWKSLKEQPITVTELAQKANLPIYQLMSLLTKLELSGMIQKVEGNKYEIKR